MHVKQRNIDDPRIGTRQVFGLLHAT